MAAWELGGLLGPGFCLQHLHLRGGVEGAAQGEEGGGQNTAESVEAHPGKPTRVPQTKM